MSTLLLEPQSEETTVQGVRTGEIFRVSPVALCYFADPATEESFCCTFGKFKGYRGEYPNEIGMLPGAPVQFALDENGDVAWVRLV